MNSASLNERAASTSSDEDVTPPLLHCFVLVGVIESHLLPTYRCILEDNAQAFLKFELSILRQEQIRSFDYEWYGSLLVDNQAVDSAEIDRFRSR